MHEPNKLSPRTVLIADDDEAFRLRLARAFAGRGWQAFEAPAFAPALALARQHAPDLAIVDLRMAGENGLDLIPRLRAESETMFILMLTGYGSIATALEAMRRGASHYLTKPVDAGQILNVYESMTAQTAAVPPLAGSAQPSPPCPETETPSLARVEWEHIQRVLTDCGHNITLAARQLGLHRRSLQRKLAKYPPRI